jgi:hypothetical protein
MISYRSAFLCILAVVLVSGCTGPTAAPGVDPLSGSWTYEHMYNDTSITATLVFGPDGNFNGYLSGILSLSGHWTKINATAYNVYYDNKAQVFFMNGDKTKVWDATAPHEVFVKQ